jgi:hypothetical protein
LVLAQKINGSITLVCFKTAVETDILGKHLKIDPTLISILIYSSLFIILTVYNAFSDPVKAKAVRPGIFKLCTIGLFEKSISNCFALIKSRKNCLKTN